MAPPPHPAIPGQHDAGDDERPHRHRERAVGPAAPEPERFDGAVQPVEDPVHVRDIGPDDERRRCEGRLFPEPGLRQRGADQGVAEIVHASFRLTPLGRSAM